MKKKTNSKKSRTKRLTKNVSRSQKHDIRKSTPLGYMLNIASDCRQCGRCCNFTSGFLVKGDIEKLSRKLKIKSDELKEKFLEKFNQYNTEVWRPKLVRETMARGTKKVELPFGRCVFLKDSLCTVHDAKPLQCKISTCDEHGTAATQWFSLNYFVRPDDPQSIREWAMFLDFNEAIPGGELSELVPDPKTLKKMLSYEYIEKNRGAGATSGKRKTNKTTSSRKVRTAKSAAKKAR